MTGEDGRGAVGLLGALDRTRDLLRRGHGRSAANDFGTRDVRWRHSTT